jgi:hypothetical protein
MQIAVNEQLLSPTKELCVLMAAINWQDVITGFSGNAALLAAAAWLIKTLVSNRLVLDAEKFKIEMKSSADVEIERMKAFLTRTAHVHERQVDTLTKLYRHFFEAQAYLQLMAASGRLEGEMSVDEYRRLCSVTIVSARDTLLEGRLLIPPDLAQQCDRFFNLLFEGQGHLYFAQHPMIADGLQRAELWDKARKTAHEEVPGILQQIDKAARHVIHGESPAAHSGG